MKIKNKKIIGLLFGVCLLVFVVIILLNDHRSVKLVPEPLGVGGDNGNYQRTWKDDLTDRLAVLFEEKYPPDYKFQKHKYTLKIPLKILASKGIDLSEFNTDTIHCDMEKSYVSLRYDKELDFIERGFYLECTNDLEGKETEQ